MSWKFESSSGHQPSSVLHRVQAEAALSFILKMAGTHMITLHKGDLPASLDLGTVVAVDTESLGLNWRRDRLCLIQLSAGDGDAHLVQFRRGLYDAPNLCRLLTDGKITKLFHFARTDMVVIRHWLGVMAAPVYCTKIASALTRTFSDKHGLKDLARDLIGLDLSKEQQTSDWGAETLSQEQLNYAASDVLHLHKLRAKLDEKLAREDRSALIEDVFRFLPTRVALDIAGWGECDIFAHKPTARIAP